MIPRPTVPTVTGGVAQPTRPEGVFQMDANKVSQGQRIAAIAGVLLFVDLWMSWYSVNIPGNLGKIADLNGIDTTATAWQAFSWTDLLMAITAVVAIAGAVMAANSMTNPLPIGW